MARFTKALRQKIIDDFSARNNGYFDPAAFLAEVQRKGEKHLAFEWFEWNDGEAAHQFRLDQARDFTRNLVVRFDVRTVHRGAVRVVERSAPLALSPLDHRRKGGGYVLMDPNDPTHLEELRRQAAQSLRWFIRRYEAVLPPANMAALEKLEIALEAAPQLQAA